MATASLSSIFSLFKDQVPNYTLKYLPEITKASKEGAEYIQKLIDLAKLKGKNLNQEKNIYTYLYKLGKVVYDENLTRTLEFYTQNNLELFSPSVFPILLFSSIPLH